MRGIPSAASNILSEQLTRRRLRAAARQLTPVVVGLEAPALRLRSYLVAVRRAQGTTSLILSPIKASALPRARTRASDIQLIGLEEQETWLLVGSRIEPLDERTAVVTLQHARLHLLPPGGSRKGLRTATSALVLAVPGGLKDNDSYMFPVTEIGTEECIVDAAAPLVPRTQLSAVELIGERRLLRTASATVEDVTPWYMEDGSERFQCLLRLQPVERAEASQAYDLMTDAHRVQKLVSSAGASLAPAWVQWLDGSRSDARLVEVGREEAVLDLEEAGHATARSMGTYVRIGFELACLHYEADVRVRDRDAQQLRVALPLTLRRRFRYRRAVRVPMRPEHDVRLTFLHPALGRITARAVVDVSFLGVSFLIDLDSDPLWEGLPLEQAKLSWAGRQAVLGDLEVVAIDRRGSGAGICRTRTTTSELVQDAVLIDLLATAAHPQVRVHTGDDFGALATLYREAGLFAAHMHRNLEPLAATAQEVWQRLHTKAPSLVRTVVHPAEGPPEGAVTVMRAWERAWLYQHFVYAKPRVRGAAGHLQMAILDHVLPRPDGHFAVFFVKTDNHLMNAFYTRFFGSTGTPESVSRSTIGLWCSRPGDARPGTAREGYHVRSLRHRDEALIARAAERTLGHLVAAGLSFQPGELRLPDTAHRMARAGLRRERRVFVVTQRSKPLYALVEERATPGLNLTWMLNATWILPLHDESDGGHGLNVALGRVAALPAQSPTGDRFLLVTPDIAPEHLRARGYQHVADVHTYVLNRAGLHRYFHYTAGRYTTVQGRALHRGTRG